MDAIDIRLCQILMQDSRIPYRELSKKLGISLQAVHRRIINLQELNIIRRFSADVSLSFLNVSPVLVFGPSKSLDIVTTSEELGAHPNTYTVLVAAGNYLYIGGFLKNADELDEYGQQMAALGELTSFDAGLELFGPPGGLEPVKKPEDAKGLTELDLRIIKTLHEDSRMALTDAARLLNLPVRTVRKRFDKLRAANALELSIHWHPDSSGDIITFVHLFLEPGADANRIGSSLMMKNQQNVVFFRTFRNLSELAVLVTWHKTMKEFNEFLSGIRNDVEGVKGFMPNIVYSGYRFDSWRDEILLV